MLGSQGNRAAREAAGGLYSQGTAGHGGQLCQRCTEQCHGDNESLGRNRAQADLTAPHDIGSVCSSSVDYFFLKSPDLVELHLGLLRRYSNGMAKVGTVSRQSSHLLQTAEKQHHTTATSPWHRQN